MSVLRADTEHSGNFARRSRNAVQTRIRVTLLVCAFASGNASCLRAGFETEELGLQSPNTVPGNVGQNAQNSENEPDGPFMNVFPASLSPDGDCADGSLNQDELMADCGGVCEQCRIPALLVDFVRGGVYEDSPQTNQFVVKNGPFGDQTYRRISYLKFDLSGIAWDATISNASVSLDITEGTEGLLSWKIANVIDGNNWSNNNWDRGITWITRPAVGQDHTLDSQDEYLVDIMSGPIVLRPDRIDPGGLYGLCFDLQEVSSTTFSGTTTAENYVLTLD